MPGERQPIGQKEREPQTVRVSRVVCVAPISVDSLTSQLNAGVPLSEISFAEALLIQKSKKSKPSAGQVMPVGGEADPNESAFRAGMRELGEEITALSLNERMSFRKWDDEAPYPAFNFKIPKKGLEGEYKEPREITMFVHPVQSSDVSSRRSREGADGAEDKIQDVLAFTPTELRQLITEGSIIQNDAIIRAADHFTKESDPSIFVKASDKAVQEEVLDRVITDVEQFENDLRVETFNAINELREIKGEDILSDLSEGSTDEISVGFVAAQMHLALGDKLSSPTKADLLKVIPYLAILPAEFIPDLLLTVPNSEVEESTKKLDHGFRAGVNELVAGLSMDANQTLYQRSPFETFQTVWPEFLALSDPSRVALLKKVEEATISAFVSPEMTKQDVRGALQAAEQFHTFVTANLQSREVEEYKISQEYTPMNEISNAGLFSLIVLALGHDVNREIEGERQDAHKILQFEAMRTLAVFNIAPEVSKQLQEADNSLFQATVASFFHFPPRQQLLTMGERGIHRVFHRQTEEEIEGKKLHLITDERDKKTLLSALRKKFQDPELLDVFSVNYVLADDNFVGAEDPIEQRLTTARAFRESLINHITEELALDPSEQWEVSILPKTHKTKSIDRLQSYLASDDVSGPLEHGGKRAGSKGDAIIREKFILSLKSESQEELIEICIYPFQSSKTVGMEQLDDAEFWGFAEKMFDDFKGEYKASRLLQRDTHYPAEPSLYEQLYPAYLYSISLRMLHEHIKSRKSQNKQDSSLVK